MLQVPPGRLLGVSSCARCGVVLPSPGAACGACGAPQDPGPARRGPVGPRRSPLGLLLLVLLSLGVFAFTYWWMATREVDAYARPARPSHGRVRVATYLLLGSIPFHLVGSVLLVGASAHGHDDEPRPRGFADPVFASGVLTWGTAWLMVVVALVILSLGLLRLWRVIRDEEIAVGEPRPLRPGLMLTLLVLPYVNLVTMWIVLYLTQDRMNRLWARAA